MNKVLILFFLIFLIGCSNKPKSLDNGLTKKASKITEYIINVKKDSLGNEIKDTLSIIEKKYNGNNQIINRVEQYLYSNESMQIKYDYNENEKLRREIVKLSNDSTSIIVNYFYKDTLLLKTLSETKNNAFYYKQIGRYKYNTENTLKQLSLFQYFIDVESNDTIAKTIEVNNYDKKKLLTKSILSNFTEPEKSRTTKYEYDSRTLIKTREFNSKDSLILETVYKYEFDEFKNWIRKEAFENDILNYINTRKIEYK
ncbi:hypothetical protein DVK85_11405 [Flavobacterium arcticum]|uniref:Uncharacterized protein n=1 Tax=Flavobacterium arcticum TaxID=1784713 RepID=A0A345HDZ2_9FLAO|nr:hypothetical protein [Flavobacterium arcticum]AXG74802.1 hypothetical protein DVK85_11405 [Flavobacterium arcticum]KAF2509700.1 hypothetical protein E0W72_09270 [Flavobacterium arcticum]